MVVRRLVRALTSRGEPARFEHDPAFDPAFYRETNADLRHLPDDEALERHYRLHGKAEGRAANREQTATLTSLPVDDPEPAPEPEPEPAPVSAPDEPPLALHELPPDFDVREYLLCNRDLREARLTEEQALEHYLRWGRGEKRKIFVLDVDLYRELYFPSDGWSTDQLREHYEQVGRDEGRIGTTAALARSRGLPGCGTWIKAIRLREFALLNWNWAPQVATLSAAVDVMLATGIERLAPLAFDPAFDPAYYREAHPDQAHASDAMLYRDWLFRGLDVFEPGSAAHHLTSLALPLGAFPDGFDWRTYAEREQLPNPTRWSALDAVVKTRPVQPDEVPVQGDGAAFLGAFAQAFASADDLTATLLGERARELGALSPSAMQSLADSYFRLGRWTDALEAYQRVLETTEANVWTFCNGARAAIRADQPAEALALLAAGRERVAGDVLFRGVVREAVEAQFAAAVERARPLYDEEDRNTADRAMAAAAEAAVAAWETLDPVGAPLTPTATPRVVILANTDLRQCTHYRVEQKVQLLVATGRAYEVYPASDVDDFMAALPGASAAIFYRLAALPANLRAIDYAGRLGVPTYYEIDDLIFEDSYPDPFETYGGSISRAFYNGLLSGVPLFRLAMERCDYGIASTTALAAHMRLHVRTGEVFVLPNGLDDRNVGVGDARPPRVRRDDDIVLMYGSGTKAHNSDFLDLAGPAIAEIMAARSDVRLLIVGYLTLDARLQAFGDRITSVPFVPDARGFWSLLAEADINLAVLVSGPVADAKSEIKWLEAAVLGIPSIVSDTARYREVLDDGVDAVIARDADEWRLALNRLIDDESLRRNIGARARAKAFALYSVEENARRLNALLQPADARAAQSRTALLAAPRPRRRRVLLVNVFFPPQTIGGATRVVRDNLDTFLSSQGRRGSTWPSRAPTTASRSRTAFGSNLTMAVRYSDSRRLRRSIWTGPR
jgi:glycosyltransferase involved in cell wall biosynthesis